MRTRNVIGIVLTSLATVFLLFDATMKLVKVQPVVEASARLGFPDDTTRPIGLVLLACLVLYVVPRTAPIGAVLLTGFLGGAVATHVRLGRSALFAHALSRVRRGARVGRPLST